MVHQKKFDRLKTCFDTGTSRYTLLFSGGVDSCCVLGAAISAGVDIMPVWIDNGFNRANENHIRQQAENMTSTPLKIIRQTPETKVCENPTGRCYFCKKYILKASSDYGGKLLDGSNINDLHHYRPGSRALKEFEVQSFLIEAGINHQEATEIALACGADLHLAKLESCLATRINYGMMITNERLNLIRQIELYVIEQIKDYNVRCRLDSDEHIRIEFSTEQAFEKLTDTTFRQRLYELGNKLARFVTVDLRYARPNEHDQKIKT